MANLRVRLRRRMVLRFMTIGSINTGTSTLWLIWRLQNLVFEASKTFSKKCHIWSFLVRPRKTFRASKSSFLPCVQNVRSITSFFWNTRACLNCQLSSCVTPHNASNVSHTCSRPSYFNVRKKRRKFQSCSCEVQWYSCDIASPILKFETKGNLWNWLKLVFELNWSVFGLKLSLHVLWGASLLEAALCQVIGEHNALAHRFQFACHTCSISFVGACNEESRCRMHNEMSLSNKVGRVILFANRGPKLGQLGWICLTST